MPKLVRGDSTRVVQIFANLISNSIKFTTCKCNSYIEILPALVLQCCSFNYESYHTDADVQRTNLKPNAPKFFFTSRWPRELILGMSKCVLHDLWIILTPFPSRMHMRKPHVEVACTHHVLGDVTSSIHECGGPTGWGRSTYVHPIDGPHTFLLKK